MAGQEGKVPAADVDAPKSPAPAPAGSDTDLKLPLAADQDPDATVPQGEFLNPTVLDSICARRPSGITILDVFFLLVLRGHGRGHV